MARRKHASQASEIDITDAEGMQVTVERLATICRGIGMTEAASAVSYEPTQKQIFFFSLVRALKESNRKWEKAEQKQNLPRQPSDPLPFLEADDAWRIARAAAHHLDEWGSIVTGLQQRAAKEWELLRIQMDQAIHAFACPTELKDDALQDALLKVFHVLGELPPGQLLETTPSVFEFYVERQAALRGVYDFSSPLYAYAQLIARNTLFYQFRRNRRELIYPVAWDELTLGSAESVTEDHYQFEDDEIEREKEAQLFQLGIDLTRLFELVKAEMRPQQKRQLVVWHTLAARSQYWLALAQTALTPPTLLRPTPQANDTDIAHTLGMSENAVRVHRKQAKIQIEAFDAASGALLETLLDVDQSNELQWWPKN
jgi:hypothetical protein